MAKTVDMLSEGEKSELIQMALSDHVRFEAITTAFNLSPDQIKKYMKAHLAPGSYGRGEKGLATFQSSESFTSKTQIKRGKPDQRFFSGKQRLSSKQTL
mgnify:CR=1 FL=1